MPFNAVGFMLGHVTATQAGLNPQRASQVGLVQGVMGISLPGLLLTQELIRRDAAATTISLTNSTSSIATTPSLEIRDATLAATSAAQAATHATQETIAAAAEANRDAERILRVTRETRVLARNCAEELQTHRAETQVVLHEHTHALEEMKNLLQKLLDSQ